MRRLLAPILGVLACSLPASAQSNVLLIVADDVGVDMIGAYGEHPNPANTPNIDALAADGLLFRNCWSNPVCSTTRATILTGRYSFRTGIGRGIAPFGNDELAPSETTLAELLAPTHETWALGKWHLSPDTPPMTSPQTAGFDHHWGTPSNIHFPQGDTYYDYGKNIDGTVVQSTTYATTDTVDDAITVLEQVEGPWFIYLAFNSAHAPWHAPPPELHSYDLPPNLTTDLPNTVRAMVEAMDTEFGRLMAAIPPAVLDDTLIIFVGDNGTAIEGTTAPFNPDHAKGTVYEGGVNVPLIMSGPGIPVNDKCKGICNTTDIFATVCDVMGIPQTTGTDSVSLVPYFSDPNQPDIRPWVYTEWFDPNGLGLKTTWNRAIHNWRFKLIQRFDQTVDPFNPYETEFYDLNNDPFEQFSLNYPPLPPLHEASYLGLHEALLELHGSWVDMESAKAGSAATPVLTGSGVPTANEPITLTLTEAPPGAIAYLLLGIQQLNMPYLGGNIVPDFAAPGGAVVVLFTDPQGEITVGGPMPANTPVGLPLYFQYWLDDPAASYAVAASNGVGVQTR